MRLTELLSYNSVSKIGWTGVVEIFSPPPRRNHLRSQPAVYLLHRVQDLSFLSMMYVGCIYPIDGNG
jgi:hypothetical protein